MKKKAKKSKKGYELLILAVLAVVLLLPVSSWGMDFVWGPFYKDISTPTSYMRSFNSGDPALVGQSVCTATILRLRHEGNWVADFFTPCGFLATTVEGQADQTAAPGAELFNFLGLRGSVAYDPINNNGLWSLGVDLLGMSRQLTK